MENLIRYGGDYLIGNLLEGRMSASSIYDFNDPFELHHRPGRQPNPDEEQICWREATERNWPVVEARVRLAGGDLEAVRKKVQGSSEAFAGMTPQLIEAQRKVTLRRFDKVIKVMCCTAHLDPHPGEIPMWGYYAECHRGVRIHFRPGFYQRSGIEPPLLIEYENEPIPFGYPETRRDGMEPFIRKVMRTKSRCWSHEAEVRLLIAANVLNFGPDSNEVDRWWFPTCADDVARVDIGIRFNNEKLVDELNSKLPGVEIYRASKDPDAFLCKYEKIA